jgi:hypothetical protein
MKGYKAMVEEFLSWFRENEERFRSGPLFAKLKFSEVKDEMLTPEIHKANIGVAASDFLASFTVWDTGMCEIIFMSSSTAEDFIAVDRHFATPSELLKALEYYGELMISGASFEHLKACTANRA